MIVRVLSAAGLALFPLLSFAADLDGRQLNVIWGLPFAGMLLSIALGPLLFPSFWHHHYGKIAAAWAAAFLLPCALQFGPGVAWANVVHAMVAEFIPFVILLLALFTVAGGICMHGNLHGRPALNTGLLGLGTLLASFMGTTGASMLLIRPLVRANDNRRHRAHTVVFFIFLVSNAGGALTPLGDPPLFLGFLKGVDFSWTLRNILPETLFLWAALLAIYYLLDKWFFHTREEDFPAAQDPTPDSALRIEGGFNVILLIVIVALVLLSGLWKPGTAFTLAGVAVSWQDLLRDIGLLIVTVISLKLTPASAHEGNAFNWAPIVEVAKLFAGIFITIVPVIAMLKAGQDGAFAAVMHAVTRPDGRPDDLMYFWATGLLSSFLDNAPTYLVFFNAASGDAQVMMTQLSSTLAAISCGAVFMGAMSYIGNAPNLMVKAIAEERGLRMPSFFGYMLWSVGILVPLFILMSWIFFRN